MEHGSTRRLAGSIFMHRGPRSDNVDRRHARETNSHRASPPPATAASRWTGDSPFLELSVVPMTPHTPGASGDTGQSADSQHNRSSNCGCSDQGDPCGRRAHRGGRFQLAPKVTALLYSMTRPPPFAIDHHEAFVVSSNGPIPIESSPSPTLNTLQLFRVSFVIRKRRNGKRSDTVSYAAATRAMSDIQQDDSVQREPHTIHPMACMERSAPSSRRQTRRAMRWRSAA